MQQTLRNTGSVDVCRLAFASAVLLSSLALSACNKDSDQGGGAATCMPGASQACVCADGSISSSLCNPDGLSFGACVCSAPAGTGGGAAGTSVVSGSGGASGSAGASGAAGTDALAGTGGASGTAAGSGGDGAGSGGAGSGAAGTAANSGDPEPGMLAGITAAHNVVRANVTNPVPTTPIPPMMWSEDIAMIAQAYAETLANGSGCSGQLVHSMRPGYGENLAWYTGSPKPTVSDVVNGWASESDCYTYGKLLETDNCDQTCAKAHHSVGQFACGHYTQVVWRNSTEVGCGVATCNGGNTSLWVCNYQPQGNFQGETPY